MLTQKRLLLADNGLEVSALYGDLGGHGFARAQENSAKIERSKRIVDLAPELGGRIVTTHIGVVLADAASDVYRVIQEACNWLAEYAHKQGAWFAIETGPEPAGISGQSGSGQSGHGDRRRSGGGGSHAGPPISCIRTPRTASC